MVKLAGILFIFAAQFVSLWVVESVVAQNVTPSIHPLLKQYSDWVNENVSSEFTRYWRIFAGGEGREPYIVYCKDPLISDDAMDGRVVRVRFESEAAVFFSRITGTTAALLASSEINVALQLDVIDCIGFGGESVETQAPAVGSNTFEPAVVEAVAQTLGAMATDKTLHWNKGVLEWSIYRATHGDLNEIYNLYSSLHSYGANARAPQFVHLAGFWAVRAFEYTRRSDSLQYDALIQASAGNCEGRLELCKGIQIELKRIGRYNGAIDGIIGPSTRQAIDAISGTRQVGDLAALVPLDAFLTARQTIVSEPAPANDQAPSSPAAIEQTPSSTVPDLLPTLPENLDDF